MIYGNWKFRAETNKTSSKHCKQYYYLSTSWESPQSACEAWAELSTPPPDMDLSHPDSILLCFIRFGMLILGATGTAVVTGTLYNSVSHLKQEKISLKKTMPLT